PVAEWPLGSELEGVESVGAVAGVHIAQLVEALDQQTRGDDQHERERRLAYDEQIASPSPPPRVPAAAFAQSREVWRRRAQRGHRATGERREQHEPERGGQRQRVQPNASES